MPEPGLTSALQQPQSQLSAPEGFLRPPNSAQPYTPFQKLKITELEDLYDQVPRMPSVLVPHDVYHEDWVRMMQDLTLLWSGSLPLPSAYNERGPPRRSTVAAEMIELWNSSFFLRRGVEVVLYKGRECRTGPGAGRKSARLDRAEIDESSDESSTDSSLSDSDDGRRQAGYGSHYGGGGGGYGEPGGQWGADTEAARRERRHRKKEKKRRERERKRKEKSKKYSLWITCVPMPGRGY